MPFSLEQAAAFAQADSTYSARLALCFSITFT